MQVASCIAEWANIRLCHASSSDIFCDCLVLYCIERWLQRWHNGCNAVVSAWLQQCCQTWRGYYLHLGLVCLCECRIGDSSGGTMAASESSQPGRGNAAGRDVAITCIWVLFVSVSVERWLQLWHNGCNWVVAAWPWLCCRPWRGYYLHLGLVSVSVERWLWWWHNGCNWVITAWPRHCCRPSFQLSDKTNKQITQTLAQWWRCCTETLQLAGVLFHSCLFYFHSPIAVHLWPSVLWCCWLGGRKGIRPVNNWVLAWLSVWSKVQTCIWPSWCHCHSLSLASVKSRLVVPFGTGSPG